LLGLAIAVLSTGMPSSARAGDDAVLIARGSEFRYAALVVPPTTRLLGPVALAGLDAVSGDAATLPSALGSADGLAFTVAGVELPAEAAVGAAPFDAGEARRCRCKTQLAGPDTRVALLYATRRFALTDPTRVTTLELAAQYGDGIAVYINGREVARRNLGPGRTGVSLAARPRGPEWERFIISAPPGLLEAGDNVLAVEVRPSGYRDGPRLDLELRSLGAARLVRGPTVLRTRPEAAVVRFTTDRPVRGLVEWGPTEALGQSAPTAHGALAVNHRVVLEGLSAAAPLYYRVVGPGIATEVQRVDRPPAVGETIRFAVYGDMRGGHAEHAEIIRAIEKEALDFIVVTGDLVLRGTDAGDWQRFFEVSAKLLAQTSYYPVAGNHDLGHSGDERRRLTELFELPPGPSSRPSWGSWYSFDVADLHFVMLDSNSYEHEAQLDWLREDLDAARARGARAIFAATHDGPYSRGIHRGNRVAQERYVPVLVDHGVAMLFSGHDHLYQRGEVGGLRYFVSGGGGAPLYSVRCGGKRQRPCEVPDGMKHVASAHHYLEITVRGRRFEVCAKRPDQTLVEPCTSYRL